jgi:hypothetical protein
VEAFLIDGLYGGLRDTVNFARRRLRTWHLASLHRRKTRRMPMVNGGGLDAATRAAALGFLGRLVTGYRDLTTHEALARANGIASPFYMPEDIFYALVLPALNVHDRAGIIRDKHNYDLLPGWPRRPTTLGRLMNGRLLDASFRPTTLRDIATVAAGLDEIVVKPSRDSSGGKNVRFCHPGDLASAIAGYSRDAVIQRCIAQHPALLELNPRSVNTVRAITYRRLTGEVIWISATLRIGQGSMRVDNQVAGGIAVAVRDDGTLAATAYDKKFRGYDMHPDTGVRFAGRPVPGFARVRAAALDAHEHTPWLDFASWDITVEGDGEPTMIEVNAGTSLNLPQLANGAILEPVADDMVRRIGRWRHVPLLGFV